MRFKANELSKVLTQHCVLDSSPLPAPQFGIQMGRSDWLEDRLSGKWLSTARGRGKGWQCNRAVLRIWMKATSASLPLLCRRAGLHFKDLTRTGLHPNVELHTIDPPVETRHAKLQPFCETLQNMTGVFFRRENGCVLL